MPVINGIYLKDFTALPGAVADANIIPIAITGDQVAYRTTVAGIITDARVTSKLLTGLSVTGGAIASTDSILTAFGKVQNQVNNRVPYTGATANVDLGTFDLTTDIINLNQLKAVGSGGLNIYSNSGTHIALLGGGGGAGTTFYGGIIGTSASFSSSGSSDTVGITHSSGSGIALNITKGGNGEGLYINKTSGSGNAATIIGTFNATTIVKNGGTSSQFLKADGSVDSTSYGTGSVTSVGLSSATSGVTIGSTPITTSGTITLAIATASGSQNGLLSSTDWTTFNNKQSALTNPVTGTGTTNYLPKFTGASTIANSNLINDALGNLGLGVTPSAWAINRAMDIAANGAFFGDGVTYDFSTGIGQNCYRTGNTSWAYKLNVAAARFELNNNNFYWYNAPSGTAGNAITFTQAMTLDSSGSLALGRTTADHRLDVQGNVLFRNTLGNASTFFAQEADNSSTLYQYNNGTLKNVFSTNGNSYITGGNVGIGTTSPAATLHVLSSPAQASIIAGSNATTVYQTFRYNTSTDVGYIGNGTGVTSSGGSSSDFGLLSVINMVFSTGGSALERMRITSGGNVGIGTTSPSSKLQVVGLSEYATNALAITGGLTVGAFYHTAGVLKVVI